MGTEAQKLISLSLEKMATCRRRRREMSLHKNLLLTTVIHKARIAIMEETYYMMNNGTYESDNGLRPVVTYESAPIYYGGHNQQQQQQQHHHHLYDDDNVPMDWEGSDGSAPVLSPQSSVVIVSTMTTSIKDDDKENVCPSLEDADQHHTNDQDADDEDDSYAATCCEQRFGACRSPDCQFLRSTTSTTCVITGQKRLMMDILMDGDDDDDMGGDDDHQKKLKWDSMIDPDSDTSHALRLVSVLSASLSGSSNVATAASATASSQSLMPTSSSTSSQAPPPPRLVRSISSPDLCSKQAKDAMDSRTSSVDRTVMAIAV